MNRPRQTLTLLAAALAAVVGLAIALPGAAQAESCTPPDVPGQITNLHEGGIGCDHAREVAKHIIIRGSAPESWSCSRRPTAGLRKEWNCTRGWRDYLSFFYLS